MLQIHIGKSVTVKNGSIRMHLFILFLKDVNLTA